MKRLATLLSLSLVLALMAGAAHAAVSSRDPLQDLAIRQAGQGGTLVGAPVTTAKAAADSLWLLGGPARQDGKFQDNTGTLPDREGWVGFDWTAPTVSHWNVSTFNAASLDPAYTPNYGMWCGEVLAPCGDNDPPEGYANNYLEYLDWYGTVANPSQPVSVRLTARLNYDTETEYDFLYLQVERVSGYDNLLTFDGANKDTAGVFTPVNVDHTFTVNTTDYVGAGFDQVHIRWTASADGAASDSDCNFPTSGFCQLDNISVYFDGAQRTFDDFQPGNPVHWTGSFPPGCGDFSKVWPLLADLDPCRSNFSPMFAWIDDGVVVPGTGGTQGVSWTYGPNGYTHNLLGGLAGPDFHIQSDIWSPVLTWPAGYDGGLLDFTVYQHLPLVNGFFWVWNVRSSADGGATWTPWTNDNFVNYGNDPVWINSRNPLTAYLTPGRDRVQIALGVWELGWVWGLEGTDGTPAPYFDNVQVVAFAFPGPGIVTREIDMANDGFPAIGTIDYANPGANSVRFDMARNISPRAHLRNDPGDSIIADIRAVRTGSNLAGMPKLVYKLKPNPIFDAYRTSGLPNEGWVAGKYTYNAPPANTLVPDRFNFDLPDTGFLFPGDVLHYYLEASDDLGGTSRLPADTTGFSLFPGDPGYVVGYWANRDPNYNIEFIVRGLPTLNSLSVGDQPPILFVNDQGNAYTGENEWWFALSQLGYLEGVDYDVFHVLGPSSGVGNGIGGRATSAQLTGYETMLYTSANLGSVTLSNGDYQLDPGNDIGCVTGWLEQGGKNLFATGDDLADNVRRSGAAGATFVNSWFGVNVSSGNLRPLINNQTNPKVKPLAGNPVGLTAEYVAYGGCLGINDFDAVTPIGSAVSIAEFLSPAGAGGAYPYAAGVYNAVAASTAEVILFPYDFMYIYNKTVSKADANLQARSQVLQQILLHFGHTGGSQATDVPEAPVFSSRVYPNPFNPQATVEFSLPRRGDVSVRVYNVRGELVRTLLESEVREAGVTRVSWDGTSDTGRSQPSGVYFAEVVSGGLKNVQKMMLVK